MKKLLSLLMITILWSSFSFAQNIAPQKVYALRLKAGDDLKIKLSEFVKEKSIQAGYIITCVGNLKQATLRFVNKNETLTWKENFEIVSLVGTLCKDGNHLHISIADKEGKTLGGHLMEGNIVMTATELVIGDATEFSFSRETDPDTKNRELKITPAEK